MWKSRSDKLPPAQYFTDLIQHLRNLYPGAAINTGNNLLYLLLGLLLALIVVSGIMSEVSLRHLTVVRRLPARAQVGRPHVVEIEVFNHKKRVPSYAIEVEDLRAGQPADKYWWGVVIPFRRVRADVSPSPITGPAAQTTAGSGHRPTVRSDRTTCRATWTGSRRGRSGIRPS